MATLISHIIDPDNGGGTDYTSLNAWEVAQQRVLPTADEIARANCRASSGSADTTLVLITGWTTDSTRYIEINGEQLDSARWDSSKYRLEGNDNEVLNIYEDYVRINSFQIKLSYVASDTYEAALLVASQTASDNEIRISNMIIQGVTGGSTVKYIGCKLDGSNVIAKVWNCIVYGFPRRGIELDVDTVDIYNCLVEGATSIDGFKDITGTTTCKNCVALNNSDDFDAIDTIDYCASDDGDGTNPVTPADWTAVFEDWANGDFRLKSTDIDLKDAGTSDPGSGLFSDDIAGDIRSGSWDIGADEYVTVGITIIPAAINAIVGKINPAIILGSIAFTPGSLATISSKVDPAIILGSIAFTPTAINAIAGIVNPDLILGDIVIAPAVLDVIAGKVDPTVLEGGNILIVPTAISALGRKVNPQIVLGSITVSPGGLITITSKADPTIILGNISLSPATLNVIARKVDPSIIVSGASQTITPDFVSSIISTINPTAKILELLSLISGIETQISLESGIATKISLDSGIAAQSNGYATFNGVDAYISIPDNDLFSFGNESIDNPFSISAWIYMNDATWFPIINKSIISGNYGGYEFREWHFLVSDNDCLYFNCFDPNNSSHIQAFTSPITPYENQWIHVVGSYNANEDSSGFKIYINGTLQSVTENNYLTYVAMHNTTRLVEIGKYLSFYADGKMRDIKIFDVELSASEVLTEYEANNRIADLVAHYKLADNAKDSGENGLDGSDVDDNVVFRSNLSKLELESSLL